jgi:hypothetical protein
MKYDMMQLKRMVNQVLRGSFKCCINANEEMQKMDHVMEVNQDIINLNSSININLNALNEEMGYDMMIKEKIGARQIRNVRGREQKIKNFVELLDLDRDYLVEKEIEEVFKLIPEENQIEPTNEENISIAEEQNEEDIEAENVLCVKSELISDWENNFEYHINLCIPY